MPVAERVPEVTSTAEEVEAFMDGVWEMLERDPTLGLIQAPSSLPAPLTMGSFDHD